MAVTSRARFVPRQKFWSRGKTGQMHQGSWGLHAQLMVLQRSKWAIFNVVMFHHYIFYDPGYLGAGIPQSVWRLTTGWNVRGSNPGGGEIFRTCPDRTWDPLSLLYNGNRVFPGGKAAEAWRWPPTSSSAEVKQRVELYLYSPSGRSWPVLGWTELGYSLIEHPAYVSK